MATKILYNQGERKIVHKDGVILPKATVRLDAAAADYLHALLPNELIDPTDATKIFDQVSSDQSEVAKVEPVAAVEPAEEPKAEAGEPVVLEELTVVQLRAIAEDRGIAIPQGTNKVGIIALLAA